MASSVIDCHPLSVIFVRLLLCFCLVMYASCTVLVRILFLPLQSARHMALHLAKEVTQREQDLLKDRALP